MEYQAFEQLIRKINGCYFASSKRDCINKTTDYFTAQQIYRLQGQFTGGSDRVRVVSDLNTSKRILPMTAKDAEPIVKMGIYAGQKRSLVQVIVSYIADRQEPIARQLLARSFVGADKNWILKELDQAGPYQGPPPAATIAGPGAAILNATVVVSGCSPTPDPVTYLAQNTGTALFGGILTADIPSQRPGVTNTVTYQAQIPPGQHVYYPQPINYPQAASQPFPPQTSNLYPPLNHLGQPDQTGLAANAPPAYSPSDAYPQAMPPQNSQAMPPQNNIVYPGEAPTPAYAPVQHPEKPPLA